MKETVAFDYKKGSVACAFGVLILLSVLLGGCREKPDSTFYLGGIMINEADHQKWSMALKDAGMNIVSATVYARQGIWNSDNIWWNEEEESVVQEIEVAKENGLEVVLILRVLLDHYFEENKFLWHGMTYPANDSLMRLWFEHYGMFVDKWAIKAEELGVDVLCIGSEMRSLSATLSRDSLPELLHYYLDSTKQKDFIALHRGFERQLRDNDLWVRGHGNYNDLPDYLTDKQVTFANWAEQVSRGARRKDMKALNASRSLQDSLWRKLIAKTRKQFSGKLSYAANFDNYDNVGFWSDLDVMGINAYFPLRKSTEPCTKDVLTKGWANQLDQIAQFQKNKVGKKLPIFFTELGYTSRLGCTMAPWQGFGYTILEESDGDSLIVWSRQPIEREERALAVEGLCRAAKQDTAVDLQGILYWKLTSDTSLLKYEPFGLSISPDSIDPLLDALQGFRNL